MTSELREHLGIGRWLWGRSREGRWNGGFLLRMAHTTLAMYVCTFLSLMEYNTGVVSLSQSSLPEDCVSMEETRSTIIFWSAAVFGSALRLPDNIALFLFPPSTWSSSECPILNLPEVNCHYDGNNRPSCAVEGIYSRMPCLIPLLPRIVFKMNSFSFSFFVCLFLFWFVSLNSLQGPPLQPK